MFIESVMSSNHLILCHTLFLLPSLFRSIRVFPNVLAVHIRWPKYRSFRPSAFHQPVRKQLPRLLFDCVAWLVGCYFPSSDQGIQPGKAQSPNHCTAREFPESTVHFLRHLREFKVEDFLPLFVWRWIWGRCIWGRWLQCGVFAALLSQTEETLRGVSSSWVNS